MATDVAAQPLLEARDQGILTLTLNRPERLNASTDQLLDALTAALRAAEADDNVRAIVLTGAGRAFCSGQDLRAGPDVGIVDVRTKLREHYAPAIRALRSLPKPVVAAVNGPAAGAGFSLALAADLRIAAESATFVQAFVRIGLIPDAGSTYFLPRLVGPARAAEMMMLGDPADAARALEMGLVSAVVADADLPARAHAMASRLASGPQSIAYIKEALAASVANDLEALWQVVERMLVPTSKKADFIEGVTAYYERSPSRFTGH